MKKFGMLLAGLAVFIGIGMGAMGAGTASAAPREDFDGYFGGRPWLRASIVQAAAETIGVSPDTVRSSLRNGDNLVELARQHGDGPNELAVGMITSEHNILDNWQSDGRISREQEAYGNWFVETHIYEVIYGHFAPDPF